MWEKDQRPTVSVDQSVALEALDLLARVITAGPATLAGLDCLAIDNR